MHTLLPQVVWEIQKCNKLRAVLLKELKISGTKLLVGNVESDTCNCVIITGNVVNGTLLTSGNVAHSPGRIVWQHFRWKAVISVQVN